MTTGERIKSLRKSKHISAEAIAAASGVSPATIYRYENGEIAVVPQEKIKPIAYALGVSEDYLTGRLEEDLRAMDIEVLYEHNRGVSVHDAFGTGTPQYFSADAWDDLCRDATRGFRIIWEGFYDRKPTPVSEDGLSDAKAEFIEMVKKLSDDDVRRLRVIVDEVILRHGT